MGPHLRRPTPAGRAPGGSQVAAVAPQTTARGEEHAARRSSRRTRSPHGHRTGQRPRPSAAPVLRPLLFRARRRAVVALALWSCDPGEPPHPGTPQASRRPAAEDRAPPAPRKVKGPPRCAHAPGASASRPPSSVWHLSACGLPRFVSGGSEGTNHPDCCTLDPPTCVSRGHTDTRPLAASAPRSQLSCNWATAQQLRGL